MRTGLIRLGVAAAFAVTAAALAAGEAVAQRVPRVGFLGMDSRMQAERVASFKDGLRALGYVEGRNVIIEYRSAEGHFERLPALAAELVAANVDVIVTAAPPAVLAAQRATSRIPIVMSVHDPVGTGIAASLSRPGGNTTGMAFQDAELSSKRLEYLRLAVPGLKRVAILWNRNGGGENTPRAVEAAAKEIGLETITFEVSTVADLPVAVEKAKVWGADGIVQLASPFFTFNRSVLLEHIARNRLPATCEMREYVVDGCLMTYSADLNAQFRRMASFVDRILKGGKPAEIAIEQPREFVFAVNGKTAQSLGLTISPTLRYQLTEPLL